MVVSKVRRDVPTGPFLTAEGGSTALSSQRLSLRMTAGRVQPMNRTRYHILRRLLRHVEFAPGNAIRKQMEVTKSSCRRRSQGIQVPGKRSSQVQGRLYRHRDWSLWSPPLNTTAELHLCLRPVRLHDTPSRILLVAKWGSACHVQIALFLTNGRTREVISLLRSRSSVSLHLRIPTYEYGTCMMYPWYTDLIREISVA